MSASHRSDQETEILRHEDKVHEFVKINKKSKDKSVTHYEYSYERTNDNFIRVRYAYRIGKKGFHLKDATVTEYTDAPLYLVIPRKNLDQFYSALDHFDVPVSKVLAFFHDWLRLNLRTDRSTRKQYYLPNPYKSVNAMHKEQKADRGHESTDQESKVETKRDIIPPVIERKRSADAVRSLMTLAVSAPAAAVGPTKAIKDGKSSRKHAQWTKARAAKNTVGDKTREYNELKFKAEEAQKHLAKFQEEWKIIKGEVDTVDFDNITEDEDAFPKLVAIEKKINTFENQMKIHADAFGQVAEINDFQKLLYKKLEPLKKMIKIMKNMLAACEVAKQGQKDMAELSLED